MEISANQIEIAEEYLDSDKLPIKSQIRSIINAYTNGNQIGVLSSVVGSYPNAGYEDEIVRVFLVDIGYLK
tara:strand:- start:20842 stop:21054 length:213 start_codon:yes stop_codon:yes gene_type:complete